MLPYLLSDEAGLITVWNDNGFWITPWRSVFERRAPNSIATVEAVLSPQPLANGNSLREVSDRLLTALTDAYREAAQTAN